MKKVIIFTCFVVSFIQYVSTQNIAINTTGADPDGSAMLDVVGANHGLLVPRVALTATGAAGPVASPAVSLLVYNTATISDVTPGYYYWNGTTWVRFFDATVNAADHDWYEVGGTDSPNSINDNIFTQGNVGIGTTVPSGKLNIITSGTNGLNPALMIERSNAGEEAYISFKTTGSGGSYHGAKWVLGMDNDGVDDFVLFDGKNHQMRMLVDGTTGNVGVGTTSPSEKLEVSSSTSGDAVVKIEADTDDNNEADNPRINLLQDAGVTGVVIGMDEDRGFGANTFGIHRRAGSVDYQDGISMNLVSGNVGIGTISPGEKLEVHNGNIFIDDVTNGGSARFSFREFSSANSTDFNMIFDASGFGDGNALKFNTGYSGGDIMTLLGSGNVGIGTISPNEKLEVDGSIRMVDGNEASGRILVSDANGTGSWQDVSAISPSSMEDADGDTKIQVEENADDDNIRFDTRGTERMILDSLGNVGIGTKSPNAKLSILGIDQTIPLSAGRNFPAMIHIHNDNTAIGEESNILFTSKYSGAATVANASIAAIQETSNSNSDYGQASLVFRTSGNTVTSLNNERVRILGNGNVGIGTISPDRILHIEGSGSAGSDNDYSDFLIEDTNPRIALKDLNGSTASNAQFIFRDENVVKSGMGYGNIGANGTGNHFKIGTIANEGVVFLQNNNEAMRIHTNGNVGIGVTPPNEKLEVNGSIRMTDGNEAAGKILVSDANGTGSWQDASVISPSSLEDADGDTKIQVEENADDDNIRFDTRGSERMIIDSLGNVGIGITNPTALLQLSTHINSLDPTYDNIDFHFNGNGFQAADASLYFNIDSDNSNTTSSFIFGKDANSTAGGSYAELMRITEAGNVGIGTTAPKAKLHVNGDIYTRGHMYLYSYDGDGVSGNAYLQARDNSGTSDINLLLRTQNAGAVVNAVVIESSGEVGIGTTTPSEKLEVSGNVLATSFIATTAGAGAYQYNSGTNMTVPDYVFEKHFKGKSKINPSYSMNTLSEVEKYIEKHHHLPRVPSRKELLKDGVVNMQGMQMITLEKVEELFIHSIEQQKKSISQEKEILNQKKVNRALQAKVSDQEKVILNNTKEIIELKRLLFEMAK